MQNLHVGTRDIYFEYSMESENGQVKVEKVSAEKDLGVIFDSSLRFGEHIRRHRKVLNIGVGKVQKIWGGGVGKGRGGGKLFASCKPIGSPAPNQCQIITYLTLKTDNIPKLRIELKSILLEILSNKIKGTC